MSSSRRASRAQRPTMVGTVLPQDSMRGLRGPKLSVTSQPLPPPPPSTASTVSRGGGDSAVKLLAAAGRDLFRHGLAFDGVLPTKQEPRHPAVTPNLSSIPEDNAIDARHVANDSHLIVIVGGPLNERGEPGVWVSNRIATAIQLYWQIRLSVQEREDERQDDAPAPMCYLVPTGAESEAVDGGVVETEAIRSALVVTGVSPHHILMDCTSTSLVENAVQLVAIARHLRVSTVHVVTSAFHVPRTRLCLDAIVRAASDIQVQLVYHSAPDGLSPCERAERAAAEQRLAAKTRVETDRAAQYVQTSAGKAPRQHSHRLGSSPPSAFHSLV